MNYKCSKIYQQIREYNSKLTDELNKIESIPPENIDELKKAELELLNKVSSIAVVKNQLYIAMNTD